MGNSRKLPLLSPGAPSRLVTVVLLGTVFVSSAVAQDSFGDCSVSFDPREASFEADGGTGETTFTLLENPATDPSSCPGSMDMLASDVPWITITDVDLVGSLIGMTGRMVKGPLKFSVDPLGLSGSRQGTISARVDLTAEAAFGQLSWSLSQQWRVSRTRSREFWTQRLLKP